MADVGTHHFVKSSAKSDRVLVPQPSQDPHDPLVSIARIEAHLVGEYSDNQVDTELESFLEVERYGYLDCNFVQSRPGTSCPGTHVSTIDGVVQFGPCWCGAIHGSLYSGAGI